MNSGKFTKASFIYMGYSSQRVLVRIPVDSDSNKMRGECVFYLKDIHRQHESRRDPRFQGSDKYWLDK